MSPDLVCERKHPNCLVLCHQPSMLLHTVSQGKEKKERSKEREREKNL